MAHIAQVFLLEALTSNIKSIAEIIAKVEKIKALADRHEISIKAAALQFSLANPAVAAVVPGASKPERIAEDQNALNTVIPAKIREEMREQKLVAPNAPLPINVK